MNRWGKIFFVIAFLFLAGNPCFAQDRSRQKDTLKVNQGKVESKDMVNAQNTKTNNGKQTGKVENNPGFQSTKQVKGARLDMSKARGARPPDIVRPTGSRIPRGIGKPAGALKPGRR